MEEDSPAYRQQISQEDWDRTPASVKKLVEEMGQRIEQLEQSYAELLATQQHLLEKINRTSKNSSSPPSLDPPNIAKQQRKGKSSKKRGGQQGPAVLWRRTSFGAQSLAGSNFVARMLTVVTTTHR